MLTSDGFSASRWRFRQDSEPCPFPLPSAKVHATGNLRPAEFIAAKEPPAKQAQSSYDHTTFKSIREMIECESIGTRVQDTEARSTLKDRSRRPGDVNCIGAAGVR